MVHRKSETVAKETGTEWFLLSSKYKYLGIIKLLDRKAEQRIAVVEIRICLKNWKQIFIIIKEWVQKIKCTLFGADGIYFS